MDVFLIPVFFAIALLYSMAGLGGGSAYVAAMVLAGIPKAVFPVTALACNLIVAGQGSLRFRSAGHFRWGLFWPFAVTSIPLAYVGGALPISDTVFSATLAGALLVASARLLFWKAAAEVRPRFRSERLVVKLAIGAALGLLAGITGIGGGIYLIPVLIFLGLATPHEAGAVGSLFVVVNSASGLVGQLSKGHMDWGFFLPLAAAVLVGGAIGSQIGARKLSGQALQKVVGAIMLIAVWKLVGGFL